MGRAIQGVCICNLQFTVCNLQFAIYNSQFKICNEQIRIILVKGKSNTRRWVEIPRQLDEVETAAIKVIQEEEVRRSCLTDYSNERYFQDKVQNHNLSFLEMSLAAWCWLKCLRIATPDWARNNKRQGKGKRRTNKKKKTIFLQPFPDGNSEKQKPSMKKAPTVSLKCCSL